MFACSAIDQVPRNAQMSGAGEASQVDGLFGTDCVAHGTRYRVTAACREHPSGTFAVARSCMLYVRCLRRSAIGL